jgi:replicative DNA helicase
MVEGRVVPHSLDAEVSVLGAILVDNAAFSEAVAVVDASMFFRDAHARIFDGMVALHDRQIPIELVTLKEELDRMGKLDAVGGPAYVASLVDGVPRSTNVAYYGGIVREKALLRRLISTAHTILGSAYEADRKADEILDEAERLVMKVGRESLSSGEFVLADAWMDETWQQVEHANAHKRIVTGVPSGLLKLDEWTRGWQGSDLIYLGARPSAGKTSLALQLALEASKHTMSGLISMEMSRKVVGMRAVALEAGVDAFRLMTGRLSDYEFARAKWAKEQIEARRFAIDDATGVTATQLKAKVRRFASRHGLGIVFIDYMQLLHESGDFESRNQELARISAGLKSLARELDMPVFVLSQLSRESAKAGGVPQAHSLRDSGALEQDADVVLLLHRPNQHDEQKRMQDGDPAQLIIAKQRNGPTGSIKLQWIGEQMKFGEEAQAAPAAAQQGSML